MEKLNLNFKGGDNIYKSICWILSIISWLLFLITGWIAIFGEDYKIWTLKKKNQQFWYLLNFHNIYLPILMDKSFVYIVFIILMGISSAAFLVYIIYSICIKTNGVFNGMMGSISRFHFIPLICASTLFLIGEDIEDDRDPKDLVIASFIFTIIGFISLIFIHLKTQLEPWYISLLIKNGTFGCLIALFTYNICNCILQIGILNYYDQLNFKIIFEEIYKIFIGKTSDFIKFINNCGTALPLTIGIVNIALSFALRDFMISGMNLVIFIGCTIYYYNLDDSIRDIFKDNGDGIIDIIMIILSCVTISLLVFFYRGTYFKLG